MKKTLFFITSCFLWSYCILLVFLLKVQITEKAETIQYSTLLFGGIVLHCLCLTTIELIKNPKKYYRRLFSQRVNIYRMSALFFGCHLGGTKDDLMVEIFLGKRSVIIDLSLPSHRNWVDKKDEEIDEYLIKEFINETKVSDQNADKV